jgi:hypothetical protein
MRVHRRQRDNLRIEVAELLRVVAAGYRADLGESEVSAAVDHPRVHEQPGAIDDARVTWRRDVRPDRLDTVAAENDSSVLNAGACDGDDSGVPNDNDCGLRISGWRLRSG